MDSTTICPRADVPAIEGAADIFANIWWLYFLNLARVLNDLSTARTLTAVADNSLTLTNAMQDISGDMVTLDRDGLWIITATVTFTADAASAGVQAQLTVNGAVVGAAMQDSTIGTYSLTRSWPYTNVGSQVAQIQAMKNAGAGVSTAYSGSSDIIAEFKGSL